MLELGKDSGNSEKHRNNYMPCQEMRKKKGAWAVGGWGCREERGG